MNRLIGRGNQPTANLRTCALSANPLISKAARTGTGRVGDGQSCPIRVSSLVHKHWACPESCLQSEPSNVSVLNFFLPSIGSIDVAGSADRKAK
jgi:hypothetical protein